MHHPPASLTPGAFNQITGNRKMDKREILEKLSKGEIPVEEAQRALEAAEQTRGRLYCKVSPKGAISLYGLQRMPVTLYVEQWERLLAIADEIRQFMKDHDAELKRKPK
jgi:hypothetical protein